jgi:hypothetical protein
VYVKTFWRVLQVALSFNVEARSKIRNFAYNCYLHTPDDGRGTGTCSVTVI